MCLLCDGHDTDVSSVWWSWYRCVLCVMVMIQMCLLCDGRDTDVSPVWWSWYRCVSCVMVIIQMCLLCDDHDTDVSPVWWPWYRCVPCVMVMIQMCPLCDGHDTDVSPVWWSWYRCVSCVMTMIQMCLLCDDHDTDVSPVWWSWYRCVPCVMVMIQMCLLCDDHDTDVSPVWWSWYRCVFTSRWSKPWHVRQAAGKRRVSHRALTSLRTGFLRLSSDATAASSPPLPGVLPALPRSVSPKLRLWTGSEPPSCGRSGLSALGQQQQQEVVVLVVEVVGSSGPGRWQRPLLVLLPRRSALKLGLICAPPRRWLTSWRKAPTSYVTSRSGTRAGLLLRKILLQVLH